jgi:hypothetical protein
MASNNGEENGIFDSQTREIHWIRDLSKGTMLAG